jgi:hypothetical protein
LDIGEHDRRKTVVRFADRLRGRCFHFFDRRTTMEMPGQAFRRGPIGSTINPSSKDPVEHIVSHEP